MEQQGSIAIIDKCVDSGLEIKKTLNPALKINTYQTMDEFKQAVLKGNMPDSLIIGLHENTAEMTLNIKSLRDYIPLIMVVATDYSNEVRKECMMKGATRVISKENVEELPNELKGFWKAHTRRLQTTIVQKKLFA